MLRGNQAAHIVERACNEWIRNAGTVLGFYIDDESKGAAIRGAGSEANVKGNGPLGQRLVFCIFSEDAGERASNCITVRKENMRSPVFTQLICG